MTLEKHSETSTHVLFVIITNTFTPQLEFRGHNIILRCLPPTPVLECIGGGGGGLFSPEKGGIQVVGNEHRYSLILWEWAGLSL